MDYKEFLIYLNKKLNIRSKYLSDLIYWGMDKEYTKEQIDIINKGYNKYKNDIVQYEYYRIYLKATDKATKDKIKWLNNDLVILKDKEVILEPEKLAIAKQVLTKLYNENIITKEELYYTMAHNNFILPITKDILKECNLNNYEYAEYYFNNK